MVETKKEDVDNPIVTRPDRRVHPRTYFEEKNKQRNVNLEFRISAFLSPTGDAPCGMRWNGTPERGRLIVLYQ